MSVTLKIRQGLKAALPTTGMSVGEPLFCTDTEELYLATGATTKAPVKTDLEPLSAIGVVATDDLLLMSDTSVAAGSPRQKKITFGDFKTALNIPAASSDEKVAAASGATAGYLGTNGTDGILRTDAAGLKMVAGGANAYVTLGLSFASEAQGDIIYRGASAYIRSHPTTTLTQWNTYLNGLGAWQKGVIFKAYMYKLSTKLATKGVITLANYTETTLWTATRNWICTANLDTVKRVIFGYLITL